MTLSIYLQVLFATLAAVTFFAFWLGEREEKLAASVAMIANVGEVLIQYVQGLYATQYAPLAIDACALCLFGVIAWRSRRSWPIWVTSFQVVSTSVLLAGVLGLRVGHVAYAAAVNLADYGVMASLAIGVFIAWREREALDGPSPLI